MKQAFFSLIFAACMFYSCNTNKHLAEDAQIQTLNRRMDSLIEQNAGLVSRMHELEKKSIQLVRENEEYRRAADDCRKSKDAVVQRMNDMNRMFDEQVNSLKEIKIKTISALSAVQDSGIEVKFRNGLLYVSMQGLLLFPSGSAKLNEKGTIALSVIAGILNEYPHVSAIIVGNTDTANITKAFTDNWSLSTERANTIVRILCGKYGVAPARLIAAGKSGYHPIASNATAEGRAQNRNTYIIINPDVSGLWLLSQKYP
jgi:chemotaxis protein MotB